MAWSAPTAAQKKQMDELTKQLQKAGQLFTDKKLKEAADEIKNLQRVFNKLAESTDPEVVQQLEPIYSRLVKAHVKLELEGFDFPALKKPEAGSSTPQSPTRGGVSFVKQVVPLLVTKCGRCHVDNARGEFSMANFDQLKKGTPAGVVVFPGDDAGSVLIDKVSSGEMPPGGNKLSADEQMLLRQWIKEGAKFDGPNPQASLRSLAPGAVPAEPQVVAVVAPSGKETISFAKDIAPVLAANCNGCHVDAQRARGNLNMTNFTAMLRGGDGGPPVQPGKSADSLLVKRIKGEGGDARMPMGRAPLSDAVIAKFEKWIAEGAKYDGGDPGLNVGQVAALAKAQSSTHAELTAERAQIAEQNWRLGMPNIPFTKVETDNFLIMGNVGEETLKDFGNKIEAVQPRIATIFNMPAGQPMVKGRMSIFIFKQRYDYGEFGQMVEKRSLPQEWKGHWRFTTVDAYGALIPPKADDYSFDALVGQQIAGTYIASLGKGCPRWFAEGSARVVASRIAPKDPRVFDWENDLSGALGSMTKADDFLTGKLGPEQSDVVSYSFVKFLMKNAGLYQSFLTAVRGGQTFDKAFVDVFKATPAQVAEVWATTIARSTKRKK
jgi:hypothetical protein